MKALIENKIKAIGAAVLTAIALYVFGAVLKHTPLTLAGLEAAAAGAVLTFLGVHQLPANTPNRKR